MSLFGKNVAADAASTIIGVGTQLALLLFLAHRLPTAGYAAYILATATIAVGEMFSDFGARMWAIHYVATGGTLASLARPAFVLKALYTLIFAVLALMLHPISLSRWDVALIAMIAFFQPSSDIILWYFRGREELYKDAAYRLVWRIAATLAMFLLAIEGANLTALLLAWLLTSVARVLAEAYAVRTVLHASQVGTAKSAPAGRIQASNMIRATFPIGIAFVLMSIYQRTGVFALERVATHASVAAFGTALSIVGVSGFLAITIATALFPRLSRSVKNEDWQAATRVLDRGMFLVAFVFGLIALGSVAVAPWLFDIVVPRPLRYGATVMQVLAPGIYISSLSVLLKYCLNAKMLNVHDAIATATGILMFLLTMLVVRSRGPAEVAAVAWNVGETTMFLGRLCVLKLGGRVGLRVSVLLGAAYAVVIAACIGTALIVAPLHARWPIAMVGG